MVGTVGLPAAGRTETVDDNLKTHALCELCGFYTTTSQRTIFFLDASLKQ